MAEYIEREAAFNALLKLIPKVDDDGYCWVIRGDAATAIDSIPAADVVEVVRCKDCKYAAPNGKYGCSCYHFKKYEIHEMTSNDYCSYGERKGGDE